MHTSSGRPASPAVKNPVTEPAPAARMSFSVIR
jgi:hypothetical protein